MDRLLDDIADGIYLHDSEGRILDCNRGACQSLGYSREELLRLRLWDVDLAFPHERATREWGAMRPGEVAVVEGLHRRRDGTTFPVEVRIRRRSEGDPGTMVAAVRDVSGRPRAQEALLHESEVSYRNLFDSITDAIYLHDDQGRFLDVNRGAEAMYGYPREFFLGKTPEFLAAPGRNDLAAMAAAVARALAGEPQHVEFWGRRANGEEFPKDVRLMPATYRGRSVVIAVARDVTERRKAEDLLRQSEELHRQLMETSPNAISVVDLGGNILMLNPQAVALFAVAGPADAVGHSVFEWVAPEDVERAATGLGRVLQGEVVQDFELKLRKSSGETFWGSTNASLVRDAKGAPHFAIVITVDLTGRKRAEAELLRTQKLDSLALLAGGIAHDFNNLMQAVFGYISLARINVHDAARALDMLEEAERALNLSINLTGQLLTFSRGGKPVKRPIDPGPVIRTAANFALSGSRARSRVLVAPDLWRADADEGQLGQVVQNMTLNASEAMPDGGVITLAVENCLVPSGDDVLPEGGRFVCISIADTGAGMSEHVLPKVFDPYFTTKPKGSGLGLATSYSIVKNHGGAIRVQSEPGKGSTFRVFLPATLAEGAPPESSAPIPVFRRGRILLMEDEDLVRNVAREMIQTLGHEVECAGHGEEAIERFARARDEGRPFDIVILDLTVKGGMGGEQAMRRLREIDPECRAIVSSGYADNPVVADFRSHGFAAFLNKPYRLDALRTRLDGLLGQAPAGLRPV